ncbi:Rpn family recombination-promoting nuclease/putative transposase [Paraliobacillus zengyii]|uniref:Rpn family recombination-promoting nuclease/putative transposase n=1 Tax=Paraliobacillus zengyii TaxID=2213194 RepID=UPI000DD2BE7A|nr:Rpn family recombination-promoting nuclease/putative transposase [Paraliobacillus zengyii]
MDSRKNQHDVGYKYLLSTKRFFLQLIASFVSRDWVTDMKEVDIERIDKSYISQDFQQKEADIVYKLKHRKNQDVIFYVLLELQSTLDQQMPYRLLVYMNEIWRDILKNEHQSKLKKAFKLPVIIPIVLYNGKNNWTAPTEFKEKLDQAHLFQDEVLNFKYILLDINRYQKKDLLQLSNLISTIFIFDQHITNNEEIYTRLRETMHILKKLDVEEFNHFKNWLEKIFINRLPLSYHTQIHTIISKANHQEVDKMISNFEEGLKRFIEESQQKAIAKGLQEGLEKGLEQGLEQGLGRGQKQKAIEIAKALVNKKMATHDIADVTGLSIKEVEKLDRE